MKTRVTPKSGVKHVPKRTCISCRNVFDKKEIIRLVRNDQGIVVPDESGKLPGRGAYLCRNKECWNNGISQNRLEHSLKCGITEANKTQLLTWVTEHLSSSENNK